MNNILELKGKRFRQSSRNFGGGGISMNGKCDVDNKHVIDVIKQFRDVKQRWSDEERFFDGLILSVKYNKIVAKSNRIAGLLKGNNSNEAIVGAKFNSEKDKHIITYLVNDKELDTSIDLLNKALNILNDFFDGKISQKEFDRINKFSSIKFEDYNISMTSFKQVIADLSYIENISVECANPEIKESIITLYNTGIETTKLFENLGINIMTNRILDDNTVYLDEKQLRILYRKAPYLVAMSTINMSDLTPEDFMDDYNDNVMSIPMPTIEPTIGVIDTLFDKSVYFGEWVDYEDKLPDSIPKSSDDYKHGTEVASIIVDGPRLNPWLDDGCGRFQVRHFGVAVGSQFSSFSIIKQIKGIVEDNRDIKVWNISLGSNQEINDNFISAEAAILDQIQYENDVIFVVAGTNKSSADINKIGSPADSINSIVVNSVTKSGLAPKYARRGLALSFFSKPDISYYGGSEEQYIRVCDPLGEAFVAGTSFAAPWISRKLSYLIDVLGMTREVAKALIIDSARKWNGFTTPEEIALYGHGIVPISIEDIVKTSDDEIKFLVSDVSEKWNTYNYYFPIPMKDDTYPYIARATMCYFPKCDRTQGVDYTNTELNLHFGRIQDNGNLNEINDDPQNKDDILLEDRGFVLEGDARKRFRKWDNVKYISEIPSKLKKAKKSYKNKNWGMEIKTNNRLDPKDGEGIRFGVVVTIKEIHGVNRIDDFVKNCELNGWIVNEVNIQNRIEIHEKFNEDIILE